MATPSRDRKLLSTFPRPPSSTPLLSPVKASPLSSKPIYRASDFGFIQVGLDSDDDDRSLYENAPDGAVHQSPVVSISGLPLANTAELQLVLDNPSRVYAPLDAITGYIMGWNPASSAQVHIILEGCAITYIRGDKAEFKNRTLLVYQILHLKRSDTTNSPPRFSIAVPERSLVCLQNPTSTSEGISSYLKHWTHTWPPQEPYESHGGRPLPPSMIMPLRSSATLTSLASGRASISYNLIAIRSQLDASGTWVPDATHHLTVHLTTLRLRNPRLQELMQQSSEITCGLSVQTVALSKDRRLSLCEQLRDAFNTAAPSFYFAAHMSMHKVSIPGVEIRIPVSLSVLPPPLGKLYNFAIPDVKVTAVDARIKSYTGLRVLRSSSDQSEQSKSYTFKNTELRSTKLPLNAVFAPKDGDYHGQSCTITMSLPESILPSFKTYNIWRSYRLECDVSFAVAGKEVSAHAQSDLNIVAQPTGSVHIHRSSRLQDVDRGEDAVGMEMAREMVKLALQTAV